MAYEIKTPMLQNIQTQLGQLATILPDLENKTHAAGRLYNDITQQLANLSKNIAKQELLLRTTADISNIVGSILEVSEVYESAVRIIRDNLDLYYAGIFLINDTNEWAELRASAGQTDYIQAKNGDRLKIDDDSTIGWAIRHKQLHFTLDIQSETSSYTELVLPLLSRGQVFGGLVLQSTTESTFCLTGEDSSSGQALADQLANVIQNFNLFVTVDRHLQQIIALHNINLQIGSQLNFETLLADVAQLSTKLMGADVGIIKLTNESDDEFTTKIVQNKPSLSPVDIAYTEEYKTGLGDFVAKTKQAVFANDWPNHPLAQEIGSGDRKTKGKGSKNKRAGQSKGGPLAILGVPVMLQGKVIGILEMQSFSKAQAFNENDLYMLSLLASQAASALENARLFEQMEATLQERERSQKIQASIYQISEATNSAKSLDELYPLIHSIIGELMPAENFYIALYDDAADTLTFPYFIDQYDSPPSPHTPRPLGKGVTEYVIRTGQSLLASPEDFERLQSEIEPAGSPPVGWLGTPLKMPEKIIGVMAVQSYTEGISYGEEAKDILTFVSTQIAMAIERKRAEQALLKSEAQYREVIENANSIILRVNTSGQITFLNKFAEEFFGYKEEEIIGQPVVGTIVSKTDTSEQEFAVGLKNILKNPERYISNENKNIRRDGQQVWVLWTIKAIVDNEGRLIEILCIGNDITKRKQADEALTKERNLLQTLVNNIPDYIFIKDEEGRFLLNNPAHLKILGAKSQSEVVKKTDFDFFPEEVAVKFFTDEQDIIRSGQPMVRQRERTVDHEGKTQWLSTTKVPLRDSQDNIIGLVGISRNVTERRQAEQRLQEAFTRTQLLYNISEALTTLSDQQATFETVLSEFILLLNLHQGSVILFDKTNGKNKVEVQYVDNKVVVSNVAVPFSEDVVAQYLIENPFPLVIEDIDTHPLTKHHKMFSSAKTLLLTPLIAQGEVVGIISAEATNKGHIFSQSDIEASKMVADQLSIWFENRHLLAQAQHRSNLLQIAAEVSRAASSILDTDQLINTSVNLIRDQFNIYYVGLFIVDETREWAVLRAGTGEAGRIQLAKKHRLKIGGESMVGWCVENRQARNALDVDEETIHFQNPTLPDTRSEMALPLISRDEVIGALTVQSVKQKAFSAEDITVLQTMADQLANAIANARLFENVTRSQQAAELLLQETQGLQQFSQALAGTLRLNEILNLFFQACTKEIGFEYVMLSLVDKYQYRVKAIDGVGVSENNIKWANRSLDSKDIMADIIRTGQTEVLTGWDDRFDIQIYETEGHVDWVRLFTPITLRKENIGLVEAGFNKNKQATIKDSQIRLMRAFVDQVALAIENSQRYEASQRATRREALIKDITTKVRASTDLDHILQTTVKEIGDAIGGKRTYVHLIPPKNGEANESK